MSKLKKNIFSRYSPSKKKLLLAVSVAFLFSLSCSVTATLAWYQVNAIFSIKHLNINFSTADVSLELGVKGDQGEPNFDPEYVASHVAWADRDGRQDGLLPVSSMYSEEWMNQVTEDNINESVPRYRKAYRGPYDNKITSFTEVGEGYVQQEFYLRSNYDCSLYLSSESYMVPNLDKNHTTAVNYGLDENGLNDVVNATRLSLYTGEEFVIVNPGVSEETYYGGLLDLNLDGYYDNIDDKEVVYGQYSGNLDYKSPLSPQETSPLVDNKSTFEGNHQPGVYRADLDSIEIAKENSVPWNKATLDVNAGNTSNKPITILHADEPKRIVCSIYVEGWDKHAIDQVQRASFDISIIFAALYNI